MSLFYSEKKEGAPLIRPVLFYKLLECLFWTLQLQPYSFPSKKKRWDLQYFQWSLPMTILHHYRRTSAVYDKSEHLQRKKVSYWCNKNKLLKKDLDATNSYWLHLYTDQSNTEEYRYTLLNSEFKGRVWQFWFTSFIRTAKITGFWLNWHYHRNWGTLSQFTHPHTGRHTGAGFLLTLSHMQLMQSWKAFFFFFLIEVNVILCRSR